MRMAQRGPMASGGSEQASQARPLGGSSSVLDKVSFLIPAVSRAWPWLTGVGLILAMIQTITDCVARVYITYCIRGLGIWLIPADLGMAFALISIFGRPLQSMRRDLGQLEGPDVQNESQAEREQRLWGLSLGSMELQSIYLQLKVNKEDHGDQKPPAKKTIVRVPLPGFWRTSAPAASPHSEDRASPSWGKWSGA